MLARSHLVAIALSLTAMALSLAVDFLTDLPDSVALSVLVVGGVIVPWLYLRFEGVE